MKQTAIEQIIRKHFQKVNKEGMGFLESKITACIKELSEREEARKQKKRKPNFCVGKDVRILYIDLDDDVPERYKNRIGKIAYYSRTEEWYNVEFSNEMVYTFRRDQLELEP